MISRNGYTKRIEEALRRSPIVALVGARQCGKTTLARERLGVSPGLYFDLEHPATAFLFENPMTALEGLRGLVVIDEAQRQPKLFPVLRVLADRADCPARFLLLGSASPELSRQSSESLAGRIEYIPLRGFDLSETGYETRDRLWQRGGFPRSFLAETEEDSLVWRNQFIGTFLERDLAALGFGLSPALMGRFWTMLAHYHGQIWNGAEIAASLGVAPNTARAYLDALEQTYMIRRLQPWQANLGKRLVKSPKLYFRDTGLLHALLGIHSLGSLLTHPKLGASWEGFVIEELLQQHKPEAHFFYGVHSGSELDLLMQLQGRRIGVEIKRMDAPVLTRSMMISKKDLGLDELWVVYPGTLSYPLADGIRTMPLNTAVSISN